MARPKSRGETFAITVHIPVEYREDLRLLARYNYSSVSSEIVKSIREHLETNHELLEREKANLPSS